MTGSAPVNAFEWSRLYFRNEDRSLHETKATMAALMTYADFNDLTCYPSQQTLASITATHISTVRRHIKKNVEAGWLHKLELGNSYKQSTKYLLTVPTTSTDASSSEVTSSTDAGSTTSTAASSTASTDALLTTKTTTHRTTHQSGSTGTDNPALEGAGVVVGLPVDASTHLETGSTGASSWVDPWADPTPSFSVAFHEPSEEPPF